MAYSDNPNEDFTPPAPTYTGGSAIMSAVDPQGNEWQFDNDKEKWVNLSTGEGLAPRDFASKASGSRNAADNTKFLADQMRQEEAQLTSPLLPRHPVVPPHSLIQPPPIAPIRYSPKQIAALQNEEPEASTAVPPTAEAWNTAIAGNPAGASNFFKARALADSYDYNQNIQRAIAGGMSYEQAIRKFGPPPNLKAAPDTVHNVGGTLVDRRGNIIFQPKKPPMIREVPGSGLWNVDTKELLIPAVNKPTLNTVTETVPATEGTPATPARGFIPKKTLFGVPVPFTGQSAAPAQPAVPAHGEQKVTRRVPAEPVTPPVASPSVNKAGYSLPLPKSKDKLVKGEPYDTPKGVLIWNGDRFVPQ